LRSCFCFSIAVTSQGAYSYSSGVAATRPHNQAFVLELIERFWVSM